MLPAGVLSCSALFALAVCTATTTAPLSLHAESLATRIAALLQATSFCARLPVESFAILRGLGGRSEPCVPLLNYILTSNDPAQSMTVESDRPEAWKKFIDSHFIGFARGDQIQAQEIIDRVVIPACPFSTSLEGQVDIEFLLQKRPPQDFESLLEPIFAWLFNNKITELLKDTSPSYKLQGQLRELLRSYVRTVSWRDNQSRYVCAFLENLTTKYFRTPLVPFPENCDFYHSLAGVAVNTYNSMTSLPGKESSVAKEALRIISPSQYDGLSKKDITCYEVISFYAIDVEEPVVYDVEVQRRIKQALQNPETYNQLSHRQKAFLEALKHGSQECQLFLYDIFYQCLFLQTEYEKNPPYFWNWLVFSSFYEFTQEHPDQAQHFLNHAFSPEVAVSKSLEQHSLDLGNDLFSRFDFYKDESLLLAAMNGHLATLEHLIEHWGASPVAYDGKALIQAASSGQTHVIYYLMSLTDVKFREHIKEKTLIEASAGGHTNIVKFMMDNTMPSIDGIDEALLVAVERRRAATVAFLLNHASAASAYSKSKALFLAASSGYAEIVEHLVNSGNAFSSYCRSQAFIKAASNGRLSVVKYIMGRGAAAFSENFDNALPIDSSQKHQSSIASNISGEGYTFNQITMHNVFVYAAAHGHTETVEFFIGSDFEFGSEAKDSALFLASQSGHTATVALLLRSRMAFSDLAQYTALVFARKNNHTPVVACFERAGIFFTTSRKEQELIGAAIGGDSKVLDTLTAQGDEIFSKFSKDQALCFAVVHGHKNAVEKLFLSNFKFGSYAIFQSLLNMLGKNVALFEFFIKSGIISSDYAIIEVFIASALRGHIQEMILLMKSSAIGLSNTVDSALVGAAETGQINTFDLLLSSNLPLEDYTRDEALVVAAEKNRIEIVKRLITSGVVLSSYAKARALGFAAACGNIETAKFLAENGGLSNLALNLVLLKLESSKDPAVSSIWHCLMDELKARDDKVY